MLHGRFAPFCWVGAGLRGHGAKKTRECQKRSGEVEEILDVLAVLDTPMTGGRWHRKTDGVAWRERPTQSLRLNPWTLCVRHDSGEVFARSEDYFLLEAIT